MQATQRLTAYDEQLNNKLSGILNKLYCKGKEMEKMIEDIKTFKDNGRKRENTLQETEGKRRAVCAHKYNFRYY